DDGEALWWCQASQLETREPVWVPAAAVFYPYRATPLPFRPATHGLAAGATFDDAVERALLECIERDVYSKAIAQLSAGDRPLAPPVELESVRGPALEWIDHTQRHIGARFVLRSLASETHVPVVLCTVIADDAAGRSWVHSGCAARRDAYQAAE